MKRKPEISYGEQEQWITNKRNQRKSIEKDQEYAQKFQMLS